MTAGAHDITTMNGDNGNGILSRMGKFSWLITFFAVIAGPFGSYMLFRQEMLVEIAKQQLQINQNSAEISKLVERQAEMVPRKEHETRIRMQEEIDRWKEKFYDAQLGNIARNK